MEAMEVNFRSENGRPQATGERLLRSGGGSKSEKHAVKPPVQFKLKISEAEVADR